MVLQISEDHESPGIRPGQQEAQPLQIRCQTIGDRNRCRPESGFFSPMQIGNKQGLASRPPDPLFGQKLQSLPCQ
jgi:hypothetical protein